jgi:uncharacterized protein
VPKDDAEAVKWFRRVADQGVASAQNLLGLMYENGQGVPQNYAEAAKWYRLAADQGVASAQYALGLMYGKGQGVTQNYAEAVKWFRFAADQGDASAQYALGLMYGNGRGVPHDYVSAHMWFNLSAARGNIQNAVKVRDEVAKHMTPAQIAEAQKLAREWKPTKRKWRYHHSHAPLPPTVDDRGPVAAVWFPIR